MIFVFMFTSIPTKNFIHTIIDKRKHRMWTKQWRCMWTPLITKNRFWLLPMVIDPLCLHREKPNIFSWFPPWIWYTNCMRCIPSMDTVVHVDFFFCQKKKNNRCHLFLFQTKTATIWSSILSLFFLDRLCTDTPCEILNEAMLLRI